MNPKRQIPKIEDIVWAELLASSVIKSRRRNERALDGFAAHGWIKKTSRKNEFEITETGRSIAEKRLAVHWPSWREELEMFKAAQLSPEDVAAWGLLKRSKAGHVARVLTHINRRSLFAWERRHSKACGKITSEAFQGARVTTDDIIRVRAPSQSRLLLKNGQSIDCDFFMLTFGELDIPERGWENVERIDAPNSRVIVSIENKAAFVDCPAIDSAMLVFVPGDNITAFRQVLSSTSKQPLIHFGDLDPEGIDIYRMLAAEHPSRHFVPSYAHEYICTHGQVCDPPWPQQDYSSFNPIVQALVCAGQWLEQEALVLDERFQADLEANIATVLAEEHCCDPR